MQAFAARTWGVPLVVLGGALVSCSSAGGDASPPERVGQTMQAVHGTVVRGSSRKVCQLIGDRDFESGLPTKGRTESLFGIGFTDLGYPVQQGNRVLFFFGDTRIEQGDVDPLGFTDETPANGTCPTMQFLSPGGDATAQAIRLDGRLLGGFKVPTGIVFDPIGKRFIGHFMTSRDPDAAKADPALDPNQKPKPSGQSAIGVFATAPEEDPRSFTSIEGAPVDPNRLLLAAPLIHDASSIPHIDVRLPPGSPGGKILLVWSTGWPYRATGVFLSAVRLEHLDDGSKWRFFRGGSDPVTAWSSASGEAVEIVDQDCVGELAVTFDPAFDEWRMTYACTSNFFSTAEVDAKQGGGFGDPNDPTYKATIRSVVAMRTASRPEGPWSPAKVLLLPKRDGEPSWGDDVFGRFIHRGNQRVHRPTLTSPELVPILGDDPGFYPDDPPALPYHCAESFPSYCTGRLVQDVDNPFVGCCTRSDRCCDFAFDQIGYTGDAPHFSWGDGNFYAPYLIQAFTEELGTRSHPRFPARQRVFYTLSTLNPYVVDLMSTDLTFADLDRDGVPDAEDNCPLTWNQGQENCNLDAELAWNARPGVVPVPILGDACDPVPCPDALVEKRTVNVTRGTCGTNPYVATVCSGRAIRDELDMAPVGPGIDERLLAHPETAPRAPIVVPNVETHARFCQDNKALLFNCDNPLRLGDDNIDFWKSAEEEDVRTDRLWHRVKLAHKECRLLGGELVCSSTALSPGVGERGDPFKLDYGAQQATARWLYEEDYAFWTGAPRRIPPIPADLEARCTNVDRYGSGTCLSGTMWLHGKTRIGADVNVAPNGIVVGIHGDELANHYLPAEPDATFDRAYGGLRARPFFFIDFTLPDPPPVWRLFAGASLPIILEGGHLVAVHEGGEHDEADFIATDRLRARMFDASTLWLSPVEASPFAGGRSAALWVGLAADGTAVTSLVSRLESGVLDIEGSGGGCDPTSSDFCPLGAVSTVSLTGPRPSPRAGFASLYARSEGKVFVVGGRDAAGRRLDEVWTIRLDENLWDRVLVGGLGEVVSAIHSWRDGQLWVIARDPTRPRRMRLLRIEPSTGRATVIAHALAEGASEKYDFRGLFLDMDGNIGIFASSERAQKHRIAVLRQRPGGYDVTMTYLRDRALSARPIVDLRGVALYFEPDRPPADRSEDPNDDPVRLDRTRAGQRLRALPLRASSIDALAELLR